jgi:DNA-binding GntR family transcriptional regulator
LTLSLASVQRSKSLQEQAYLALRTSILTGELLPGDRLVETQLAEKLQVSRTPVREALRQLQRDGLVVVDVNGNLRVATISAIDVMHLYDCRIALERLSIQGACQYATPTQLQALENLVIQAEQLVDDPQNSPKMLTLDFQFHHQVAKCADNPWLVVLLDQVFDKMTLMRVQTTRHNPRVLEIRGEHRRICEAIARKDSASATQAIESHLMASKARVLQEVESLSQLDPDHS